MPDPNRRDPRIVAVALLTEPELRMLGQGFDRFYPVDETPCFGELLHAIDEAERRLVESEAGAETCADLPPLRPRQ